MVAFESFMKETRRTVPAGSIRCSTPRKAAKAFFITAGFTPQCRAISPAHIAFSRLFAPGRRGGFTWKAVFPVLKKSSSAAVQAESLPPARFEEKKSAFDG